MKKTIKIKILNIATNEIYEQYLSSEKIRKAVGWKAEYSFERGIKKTVPWYKKLFRDAK
jgi:nucleoside-diphosphate-sugar epimerase